ncbi:MAG: hypothetical protein FWE40_04820 [Oscillospiraceae bacterium]|nr:hypothetical protein [Oscillospiraceae bacterium]
MEGPKPNLIGISVGPRPNLIDPSAEYRNVIGEIAPEERVHADTYNRPLGEIASNTHAVFRASDNLNHFTDPSAHDIPVQINTHNQDQSAHDIPVQINRHDQDQSAHDIPRQITEQISTHNQDRNAHPNLTLAGLMPVPGHNITYPQVADGYRRPTGWWSHVRLGRLLICWGEVTNVGSGSSRNNRVVVILPEAYQRDRGYSVTITPYNADSTWTNNPPTFQITNQHTRSFQMRRITASGSVLYWQTIGLAAE